MNSTTRVSARALLAIASLAASPAAWSLGLGDATVESYLNQPLEARIDLITQESDDLGSVSAKLASAADYELIGASLEDLAVPVRFSVENIDGDAYIRASSQVPVNSPVVRLIVEVNWASGRMLREYTLFLDPPAVADQAAPLPRIEQRAAPPAVAPQPYTEPVEAQGEEPSPAPASVSAPAEAAPAEPAPPTTPARPDQRPVPAAGEYGPVASGDTLWRIANDWAAGRGVGVNQAMLAIQRENPQAFLNGNINLLKRGAILRMPAVEEARSISTSAAYNEVIEQEEAFRQGRSLVSSPDTPLLAEERAADADEFTIPDLAPAEEVADEAPAEPGEAAIQEPEAPAEPSQSTEPVEAAEAVVTDQLELVPPSEASELDSTYGFEENPSDGDAAMAAQALRENLARAEEDLINQQQQNEYLQQRIQELESALDEARENAVADPELAAMEQRLREQREAVQTSDDAGPWYTRFGVWLLGLLIVAAAAAGWLFSRRSRGDSDGETIQGIKDEAEEVLRVLEEPKRGDTGAVPRSGDVEADDQEAAQEEADEEDSEEPSVAPEAEPDDVAAEEPAAKQPKSRSGGSDDEASFLDTESSDPEIQLDLARAYISMGDKEAARIILEEVALNGSDAQQAEAKKMLELL